MSRTPENLLEFSCEALEAVRTRAPLVHSITNSVVVNVTANTLLALGAAPAMVDIPDEAGPFATIASGVLINLGTPTADQRTAMIEAVLAANAAGTPWVLDPVAIGALPVRTRMAHRLRELSPTIIRGNASEILALAEAGTGGRGVDATDAIDVTVAEALALSTGAVVSVSGPTDVITDGVDTVRVTGGSPLLTKVTGGGCALGAVMAAFASVADDALATTVAANVVYSVAAEVAAARASGPGSVAVDFLDALSTVTAADLRERAVIA